MGGANGSRVRPRTTPTNRVGRRRSRRTTCRSRGGRRPGYVVDRFPDRNWRVPYRGQDYFFSGGYWYRPQGPRYVVVAPPRGIRVSYLPDYAREVWVGSSLFFLAAGAYYLYQDAGGTAALG